MDVEDNLSLSKNCLAAWSVTFCMLLTMVQRKGRIIVEYDLLEMCDAAGNPTLTSPFAQTSAQAFAQASTSNLDAAADAYYQTCLSAITLPPHTSATIPLLTSLQHPFVPPCTNPS